MTHDEQVGRRVRDLQQGRDREKNTRWLFDRFYYAVKMIFVRKGCSADECSDLAQDTFLKAFEKIEQCENVDRFDTWLFSIARNLWNNDVRSRNTLKRDAEVVPLVEPADAERLQDPDGLDPEAELLEEEELRSQEDAFDDTIEGFPLLMKQCLLLRVKQGLKYREISVVLGIPLGKVKTLLFEGRKRLRRVIDEQDPESES